MCRGICLAGHCVVCLKAFIQPLPVNSGCHSGHCCSSKGNNLVCTLSAQHVGQLHGSCGKGNSFNSHLVCWSLHGDTACVTDAVAKATILVHTLSAKPCMGNSYGKNRPQAHFTAGHCMQILQQAESAGSLAHSSSGSGGGGHNAAQKRTEAKLVLQLATWMANTGQGAKADITGLLLVLCCCCYCCCYCCFCPCFCFACSATATTCTTALPVGEGCSGGRISWQDRTCAVAGSHSAQESPQ